jgi:hypothetical protein
MSDSDSVKHRKKRHKSEWSSESEEEQKKSYEPSKNAADPTIKSRGFAKQKDSTAFADKPRKGQKVEEITFEKLMELEHTDEVIDPYTRIKKKKKKRKSVDNDEKVT